MLTGVLTGICLSKLVAQRNRPLRRNNSSYEEKLRFVAAIILLALFVIGFIVFFLRREPKELET